MSLKKQFAEFPRIAPCLLTILVDYMGFGLVLPLVTVMFSHPAQPVFYEITNPTLKNFYFGIAIALYPFMMFFGAAFLGDLSDRWGRKKVLLCTMVGIFLSFVLMTIGVYFHFLSLFLIGRGLSGLFAGSQPLAQAAVADISSTETKAWNMSLVSLTNVLSIAIGPILGGLLSLPVIVAKEGYFLPFAVASVLALVTFFWIYGAFKETYSPAATLPPFDWLRPLRIFKEALVDRDARGWMIAFLFFQLGFGLYFVMISLLLRDSFSYSSTDLGLFFGFMGICFAICLVTIYPRLLHYPLQNLAVTGLLGMGVFIIVSSIVASAWGQWIVVIFLAGFNIIGWTASLAYYSNIMPIEKQGWAMGVITASVALAFMLSGLASNLLNITTIRTLIFFAGISGILSSIIVWLVTRQKRPNGIH